MQVRKIKENELEKLLLLYKHLHPDEVDPSAENAREAWEKIFNNDSFQYFVIEKDEQLIASCNVTIIPNLTRGARPFALIENVVTHGDHQRGGLGKKIMVHAMDHARNRGCYKIMLLSNAHRKEAHRFYEGLGFSGNKKVGYVMDLR